MYLISPKFFETENLYRTTVGGGWLPIHCVVDHRINMGF